MKRHDFSRRAWRESPDRCIELLARAINYFQQAGRDTIAADLVETRDRLRRRHTCFLTNLRLQGEGFHFRRYNAQLTPYVLAQIKEQGHDDGNIDTARSEIMLSTVAATLIEQVASEMAERKISAFREEISGRLDSLSRVVRELQAKIDK